jgi:hypothetical protein
MFTATAASNVKALPPPHLAQHLSNTIDLEVGIEHALYFGLQGLVTPNTRRQARGIATLASALAVGGWGDRQNLADRLDPVIAPMLINEAGRRLKGQSSIRFSAAPVVKPTR